MKITLIGPFPPFRGGISDFNFSLSKELSKHHELQIINFTTQYPKILFPGKTQYKPNNDIKVDNNRILSSVNYFSWKKTAKEIIKSNPDLIIFQYWMPFFTFAYNSILKRIKDIDTIAICHNLTPHEDRGIYKYLTKSFLNKIDKFIVMSDVVKSDLMIFKSQAAHKTLFHPVYELFGSELNKQVARDKLGYKEKKIILFFGLVREYKGLDILLKSIPLFKNINDFKVVIAGECYEDPGKYLQIIKKLKIKKYVDWRMEFIPDDDVGQYFSAADVVVLPYRNATQSGVTQIAYNYNRPVIISNVGSLSEVVKDGLTGFVVKPEPEDFAQALGNFFQEDKSQKFQDNIKEHKKKYSWESFTKQLLEFSL